VTDRGEALALSEEVGVAEAARRLGMPAGTLKRWRFEARQAGEPNRTEPNHGGGEGKPAPTVTLGKGGRRPNTDPRPPQSPAAPKTRTPSTLSDDEVETLPLDALADRAIRIRMERLARKDSLDQRGQQQLALAVAILADKRATLAAIEKGEPTPDEKATEPASDDELAAFATLAAEATGQRPEPAATDDYDPDTAGGPRSPGPRLVVVNDTSAE
jgi:transposase-like protein